MPGIQRRTRKMPQSRKRLSTPLLNTYDEFQITPSHKGEWHRGAANAWQTTLFIVNSFGNPRFGAFCENRRLKLAQQSLAGSAALPADLCSHSRSFGEEAD